MNSSRQNEEKIINVIVTKICDDSNTYKFYAEQILDSLYGLGYHSPLVSKFYNLEKAYFRDYPEILLKFLLNQASNDNEIKGEFEEIFQKIISSKKTFYINEKDSPRIHLFVYFLKRLQPNLYAQLPKFFKKSNFTIDRKEDIQILREKNFEVVFPYIIYLNIHIFRF